MTWWCASDWLDWCSDIRRRTLCFSYQQKEAVFEVLVGLDAAVLRPLVVQGPGGVEEGHVAVPARAEVDLLQLQLVGSVQVLLWVPQHSAVQRLTCGGQQRDVLVRVLVKGTTYFRRKTQ